MLNMVTRRVKKLIAWLIAAGVVGLLVLGVWTVASAV
jgi:hypothetical protein